MYLYYIGLGDEGSMVKGRRVNFLWVVGYPNFLWWAELQNFCGVCVKLLSLEKGLKSLLFE